MEAIYLACGAGGPQLKRNPLGSRTHDTTMTDRPSFDAVAHLLADLRAEPLENITPATRLRDDLGIAGDDWDEVLLAINNRWPVDWAGFDFYTFFDEEPHLLSLVRALLHVVRGRRLRPLTVGHLSLVLQRGKWFDPADAAA